MPAGISDEVYEFTKAVLYKLLQSEKNSVDVTLNVFKRIDSRPSDLATYQKLNKALGADNLHRQMGKAVKHIEGREDDQDSFDIPAMKNIQLKSYMRFKSNVD